MKRLRVDETSKDNSGPQINNLYRSALPNATPTISYSNSAGIVNEGMQSSLYPPTPPVNYAAMPTAATPHSGKPQAMQPLSLGGAHSQLRGRGTSSPSAPVQMSQQQQPSPSSGSSNFPRLKVEDALSYLDLVKLKFGNQPQVYNDFLDIMKEFKSQSIDTPGVIQRVSVLFRGFPDLIVGFNTFLPPGYKIEVQRSDSGYAFQVSVSVPSPTGTMVLDPQQQKPAMLFSGSGTIIHNNMSSQGPPTCLTSSQSLPIPSHTSQQPQAPPPSATVLHNLSTYGSSTPIHNNSTHNALTMSAAVSQALGHAESPQNQPVEFNHAINYVNKIKNRFQGQPEKYKRFLEILHTYQKEQRTLKESSTSGGPGKHLTEQEVYSQVAKLFENQSDLLAEFGQFLPDATSHTSPPPLSEHVPSIVKKIPTKQPYRDHILERNPPTHKPGHLTSQVKRSPPYPSIMHRDAPPAKKHKLTSSCRDVTTAEASKYGTLNDYAFFDKVRKALRSTEVYYNFLRCLHLYNQEIVSKSELVQLVTPFLGKYPEMLKWFKEFLGQSENEPISYNVARAERPQGEHAIDIDLTTAKRLGASYCIIPPTQEPIKCSGRTQLCKDVLNDQWVSFPTWSEDSTFVSSRKTQYEEYMYRCEDERFELDVVIETNAATIRVLEGVQKRFSRMNSDEVSRFRLDDCLGGNSPVLHQRALKRIYGDKAQDIIEGLKRSPAVAVPVVLRRLKAKEEEWREAQKGFNKIWREQNEKFYLKSLDHQGINFKQNDTKAIKPKNIVNEIETLFDERNEQNEEEATEPITGPHMVIPYKDKTILDDAANLLIHHVKRQTGIQKGEKRRIKHILRQFVPDLFFHPRQQLSDDEREDDDEKDIGNESPNSNSSGGGDVKPKIEGVSPLKSPLRLSDGETSDSKVFNEMDIKEEGDKTPTHAQTNDMEEAYTLFMASINWYSFLRLHAILCERLAKMYERALVLAREEVKDRGVRKETTAVALRLKTKSQIEVEDFYPAFLDMVKNLLDGNMDSNTYEDTLREMFGIHAYIAFTLDKVVQYAVRQLQSCVTERTAITVMELFQKEHKRGGAGGLCVSARKRAHLEFAHQRVAENTLQSDHCFKICIYKRDSKMTIELLDTVSEDSKKPDEARNWSTYTERYADCSASNDNNKLSRSPVYLNRNLRNSTSSKDRIKREDDEENESNGHSSKREDGKRLEQLNGPEESNHESNSKEGDSIDAMEKKLHNRPLPQRNQSEHPGYDVSDETQCKIDGTNSKIRYTVNKDSYLYKERAFRNAKLSHPSVTKRLGIRFRSWLKRWTSANVSDTQQKQCIDWLMGRSEGVVPNRTRVVTNNDVTRSPYSPFNRYRVERLNEDVV